MDQNELFISGDPSKGCYKRKTIFMAHARTKRIENLELKSKMIGLRNLAVHL